MRTVLLCILVAGGVASAGCSGSDDSTNGDANPNLNAHAEAGSGPGPGGFAPPDGGAAVANPPASQSTTDMAPAGPQCPAEAGSTRVGARWVYALSGSRVGSETRTVTAASVSGGALSITVQTDETSTDASGNSYSSTTISQARCDADGESSSTSDTTFNDVVSGKASSGFLNFTYSPSLRGLPADLQATPSWTTSGTIATQTSTSNTTQSYDYTYTVGAKSSVTVAAGSFDVIAVILDTGASSTTELYAAGVGAVKGDGFELQSYTP